MNAVYTKINYFFLIFFITICFVMPAQAIENADNPFLVAFQQQEPELFKRVKLVTENKRDLIEISLNDILSLVLKRSITIESQRLGEEAAQAQLIATQEARQSNITVTAQQNKTPSLNTTNFDGTDTTTSDNTTYTSPYLTSTSTDSTTLATTWSKTNSLGMSFSSTLKKTTSQSKYYYVSEEGDAIEGGTTTDDPLETTKLSANVSIPIFQGWGDVNNLSIYRSELAVEQSLLNTHLTGMDLLESVAKTYWSLVEIRENIKTLQDAVKLSELLVTETRSRVEVGVLNPTDLKQVMTQLAGNQQELLSARIQEQEIEDQIRTAVNLGQIPYGFKPADHPIVHDESFKFETLLLKMFQNNTDLKQLELSLKSNKFDLDEALDLDKTNLDLDIEYSLSGYGGSSSESIQAFKNQEYQGYQVGITWTVPLFDKVTPQKIIKRKIERNKLELQIQDKKNQLSVSLQTTLRNIRFGLEEQKTALLSVNLAKDLLEKEVEKLKIGKSTSYNVSQAQQKYTDAKLAESLVRVKSEKNFVSLLILTGDIFNHFGLPENN